MTGGVGVGVVPNNIARKSGPLEIEIIQYSLAGALLRDVANSRDVFYSVAYSLLHSYIQYTAPGFIHCRKKNKIETEIECVILWYYAAFLKQKKYRKAKISHTNFPLSVFVKPFQQI